MTIVLICFILGLTPFAVAWNYRMRMQDSSIPIEELMSVMPHEFHISGPPDFDDY